MMCHKYLKRSLFIISLALFSCSSGSSGDGNDDNGDENPDTILPPEAAILVSPAKDEACNQGNIVSTTQSRVTFDWNASENTNNYTFILKNLDTNVETKQNTASTSITLTIARNIPYSWKVISTSNKTTSTATSETWKFYNAGEGIESYAPFPVELVAPEMGSEVSLPNPESTMVSLLWSGSDIDDDMDNYQVYLGTTNPPESLFVTTTPAIKNGRVDFDADYNTVYYWRVVTNDKAGNSSQSSVFEFRTEP